MKISTKGRYALRMLLDLARHSDEGYVSLKDVSEREGISKKYLEQIVTVLIRDDVLTANRGYQGGYRLTRSPKDYTVGKILRITEGNLAPVSCLEHEPNDCPRRFSCPTLPVWEGLNKVINEYLDGITLQDLLDSQAVDADNYII